MSLLIPSYKAGFARNAAEAAYPNLRKGLVGAWAPFLGPTGLTLFDWGGRHNHGTLTNMDPANCWKASPYGYALDLIAASSQYIDCGDVLEGMSQLTLSCWFKADILASGQFYALITKFGNSSTNRSYYLGLYDDNADGNLQIRSFFDDGTNNGGQQGSTNLTVGQWYFAVAMYYGGGLAALYLNGVPESVTGYGTIPTGAIRDSSALLALAARMSGNAEVAEKFFDGQVASASIRSVCPGSAEIQQLYADPHALFRLESQVLPAAAAPPGLSIPIAMRHYLQMQQAG